MHKPLILLLAAAFLAGCGITYKQPIYQGNLIDPAAAEQLQAGMSKRQVVALLGSPPVADPFHQDRWDYVATQRVGRRGNVEMRNFTLHFQGEQLARWEGDYFARDDEALAAQMRRFGNLPRERDQRRPRR